MAPALLVFLQQLSRLSSLRQFKASNLNIYSPNTSTTSTIIPCTSTTRCISGLCLEGTNSCYYQISYADGTLTSGIIVEDTLHLATDDDQQNGVDASITLGCGMYQTSGAITGLFGLGTGTNYLSVPSILASKGLTADSFSMCFGLDGVGRIIFGDKGSSDQGETPFFGEKIVPHYTTTVTEVVVGGRAIKQKFTPIFDSGSTYTYLEDPAYTTITSNFNTQVQDSRYQNITPIYFEYCYNLRSTSFGPETPDVPKLVFTMNGGKQFNIATPVEVYSNEEGDGYIYCLTLIKSVNISILGQNFMTGYNMVFDRERKVLGWKESDCYGGNNSNSGSNSQHPPPSKASPPPPPPFEAPPMLPPPSPPINQRTQPLPLETPPPFNQQNSSGDPFTNVAGAANDLPISGSISNVVQSNSFASKFLMIIFYLFSHYLVVCC